MFSPEGWKWNFILSSNLGAMVINKRPWSDDMSGLKVEHKSESLEMYEGATPCRAFYVISGISKSIQYFEGMRGLVGCGIYGSLQSRFAEYKLTQQTDHTRRSLTNQRSLNSTLTRNHWHNQIRLSWLSSVYRRAGMPEIIHLQTWMIWYNHRLCYFRVRANLETWTGYYRRRSHQVGFTNAVLN